MHCTLVGHPFTAQRVVWCVIKQLDFNELTTRLTNVLHLHVHSTSYVHYMMTDDRFIHSGLICRIASCADQSVVMMRRSTVVILLITVLTISQRRQQPKTIKSSYAIFECYNRYNFYLAYIAIYLLTPQAPRLIVPMGYGLTLLPFFVV